VTDFTPFREIVEEWYARDTSRKIKSAYATKGNSGKPMSNQAPYGYAKDPEDTHEAIINKEDFDRTQQLLVRDTRKAPKAKELYLFSGFLKCPDCGREMARSEVKGNVYYRCSTYSSRSKNACTAHAIKHFRLETAGIWLVAAVIIALRTNARCPSALRAGLLLSMLLCGLGVTVKLCFFMFPAIWKIAAPPEAALGNMPTAASDEQGNICRISEW